MIRMPLRVAVKCCLLCAADEVTDIFCAAHIAARKLTTICSICSIGCSLRKIHARCARAGTATAAPVIQAVDANSAATAGPSVHASVVTARAQRAHRNLIRRFIADWCAAVHYVTPHKC